MTGDADDMAARLRAVLPSGWFGEVASTPVLGAVLQCLGTAFSSVWTLLQDVIQQSRIATATASFLDMISVDFYGPTMVRLLDEEDDAFRTRIMDGLLRPRGTRAALSLALLQLTGKSPVIFEPSLTTDTGGYSIGGVGYGEGGGWGSLALPFQFFVTVFRPSGGGIAEIAGYSSGGIPVYGSLSMEAASLPDSAILAAVPPLLPAATIAWMRLTN